jgi:hypothetical protein
VGMGVIGFEAEGFPKFADRVVRPSLLAQGEAEVVVGFGVMGLDGRAS